jgi:hypothetical protein
MKSQAGAARMVAAGCVDQQDVRQLRKVPNRSFEQRPLAQGEQTRLVRCAPRSRDNRALAAHDSGAGPAEIPRGASPARSAREADEAAADRELAAGHKERRRRTRQLLLFPDQLVHGRRPGAHEE